MIFTGKFGWLSLLTWALGAGGCLTTMTGCQPLNSEKSKQRHDQNMEWLKDAKAKGHAEIHVGGAPLGAGTKTVVWLGPEGGTFEFSGDIDFSEPNASQGAPDLPGLPEDWALSVDNAIGKLNAKLDALNAKLSATP